MIGTNTATIDARTITETIDVRRAAILVHARRTFLSQGYDATRMEYIARAATVSTATLYGYFPSKEVLFSAVIDDAAEDFACEMEAVQPGPGVTRQRLTNFARAYAVFMSDPFVHDVLRIVLAERRRFEDLTARFFQRGRQTIGAGLIEIIDEAREQGELACERPSRAAGQLLGMIDHSAFLLPLIAGDASTRARDMGDVADQAVETFLARYGVRQG